MNESELLFTELLDCDRLSLYLNKGVRLNKEKSSAISCALKRRIFAEPLQYILGRAEFMGLEFKLTPDVFIPRPETEILVEKTIAIIKLLNCQIVKLLDIGTGSGCIAVSLAKLVSNLEVNITATDISQPALNIAEENAKLNNVNIKLIQSDLFNTYGLKLITYDLIVSNPPYIPALEIKNLQPELKYEPRIALDGGKDGLDFYRKIIAGAGDYLREGGFLIMEMGFNQKEKIEDIFQKAKNFKILEIVKDYNNIDRVIVAKKRQYG